MAMPRKFNLYYTLYNISTRKAVSTDHALSMLAKNLKDAWTENLMSFYSPDGSSLHYAGHDVNNLAHLFEAAGDAGFDVAPPERCHLAELLRNLDAVVE